MKPGQQWPVSTSRERVAVNQLSKDFFRAGFINFKVFTRKQEDGTFLVVASI